MSIRFCLIEHAVTFVAVIVAIVFPREGRLCKQTVQTYLYRALCRYREDGRSDERSDLGVISLHSTYRKTASPQAGFTLVELVVTILLIGILAYSVIPRYQNRNVFDVNVQAEQLASDIRYAQSLAMTSGQRNRINLTAASYQITTSAGVPVAHPATGSSAAISLSNVSLSGYNPPLTNSYIAFDGKGIPYTDVAGTALGANATITLSSPGTTPRQVVVSPQTGRVIVQ